jgi:hypothetical protein
MAPSTSRTTELDDHSGSIVADWRWPDKPLVRVCHEGRELAVVDYLPASAATHWFLKWTAQDVPQEGPSELALTSLVTRVPEEVDGDESLRAVVLDTALEAVIARLSGRPATIEPGDDR